jgi:hypothetical protein
MPALLSALLEIKGDKHHDRRLVNAAEAGPSVAQPSASLLHAAQGPRPLTTRPAHTYL